MLHHVIGRKAAVAAGKKRYFTGGACPRGHSAERYVSSRRCVACAGQDSAAGAYANPEKNRARNKRWRERHPEKHLADVKRWQDANREIVRGHKARWSAANPEKQKDCERSWRENNKDAVARIGRAWRLGFPEKALAHSHARRARKLGAGGSHTAKDIADLVRHQSNRCAYCHADFSEVKRHIDHVAPISRGGSNGPDNLQLLCRSCNQRKHAKDPIDFARELGRLC